MLAYQRTTWIDRDVENPRTYTMVENPDGTVTFTPSEGTVIAAGTLVNAARLNNLEAGAEQSLYGGGSPLESGVKTRIEYDSDGYPAIIYSIDSTGNNISKTELTYVDGKVTSAEKTTYGSDGTTITNQYIDTLQYHDAWIDFEAGDCENHALWTAVTATLTTDTANKIQGLASVKITATADPGQAYYNAIALLDPAKHYFASFWGKNGTGSGVRLRLITDGVGRAIKDSGDITGTSVFENKGVVISPADWGTGSTYMRITGRSGGAASTYGYMDCVKIWEISASDALLTESQLLLKYPNIPNVAKGSFYKSERTVVI